jgi:dihydrofolate reductase
MITLVVAVAENGVIGRDGGLPWRLSGDLKRFRADTIGRPVIMGRRTYEAIGRPLPGRINIVVTRRTDWRAEGVERAASLAAAIEIARGHAGEGEICVIGGGEIYREAMPLADRLKVTHVLAKPEGDTRFPEIDPELWRAVSSADFPAGEKDSHATRYVVYDRRR